MRANLPHRVYVATMQVFGEEGRQKVARHRDLRAGKGFVTLEQTKDLEKIICDTPREQTAILLECLMNLAANEMFAGEVHDLDALEKKMVSGLIRLAEQAHTLVIVTGQVGEDGISYEKETADYIRLMGRINQAAAAMADCVIQAVCGIAVVRKERKEQT